MNEENTEIIHGMSELGKSRSQKKRESTALQKLGEAIAVLPPATLDELGLPQDLDAAIRELRAIKKHEARRRQMQLVGRYMRELDEDEQERIAAFLDNLDRKRRAGVNEFHELEALRDALVDEASREETLERIAAQYPEAEIKKLRHLATTAEAERRGGKGIKNFRELFRVLKSLSV